MVLVRPLSLTKGEKAQAKHQVFNERPPAILRPLARQIAGGRSPFGGRAPADGYLPANWRFGRTSVVVWPYLSGGLAVP